MNDYEEELQNKLEAGLTPNTDELDIKSYQELFNVLKKEPPVTLSADFTSRVIAKVTVSQKKSASRDFWWLGLGIFFTVICFIVVVVMTGFKFEMGFLKEMSRFAGLFIFGVVFIIALNLLEKRVLPERKPENHDFSRHQ
jgi:hypothetical protein